MKQFQLRRRKQMELVLPNNYVVIDEEEMMYLDGGAYLSKRACQGICAALA
ncbi:argininosuccinate lyase, partial [Streptococcus pneumoniae]|nr:argininosuccinate lyase [Streptococcus pneumoniae]